jgi:single-strand DNA-binding protein
MLLQISLTLANQGNTMNNIMIAGHLGADPENRFTQDGRKVTSFRVATNVRKGGQDQTVWFRVSVWGDRFDKMMVHLKKGSAVIVHGEMGAPQIYTDKNGQPQVSIDVTADRISFSPFGKGERTGSAPGASNASSSFGEQTYGDDFESTGSFGTASGSGRGNYASDEKVPF